MLIALCCVTIIALATLTFAHLLVRDHREARAQWALDRRETEAQWARERSELLTRIQRPEHIPVAPAERFVVPEQPEDEWNLVGTINHDPSLMRDEDTAAALAALTPAHLAETIE